MLRDRGVFLMPSKLTKILKGGQELKTMERYFVSEVLGVPDEILFPDRDRVGWAIARLFGITKLDARDS